MKKSIAIILIIALTLSLGMNFLIFKPKKANAVLGIGDITVDIVNQVKEWVLDQLPKSLARHGMVRIQQEIARWAQGGFTEENKPFAMTDWKAEVNQALNIASGRFIQEFNLTPLCMPLQISIGERLELNRPYYSVPYTQYAACTIDQVVDNAEAFWENPSISVYGWDTWSALMRPENNIFGATLMAIERRAEIEEEEVEEKEKEFEAGQGYMNENECMEEQVLTEEQLEACKNKCREDEKAQTDPMWLASCIYKCDSQNTGICLEYRTTNVGSSIHSSVEKSIGSDIDWLITADEITELLNLVFSSLFSKMMHGIGLTGSSYAATSDISKQQLEYGYHSDYKKSLTSADIKEARRNILENILNSVKKLSTTSYECDTKHQLEGRVFQEMVAEIIDQEAQHLYSVSEGVDLKPDFQVLDSAVAVNNGYAVYGQTWDDIPLSKYPQKCLETTDTQCKNITTRLPYELNISNINDECSTGCLGRINEYRIEGFTDAEAVTKATQDGYCSTTTIGTACIEGAHLINKTKNRCEDCITKAESICSTKIGDERESCIELYCSNYEDISTSITSAEDFYNRCGTSITKEGCYTCLKEYFMPAYYCWQMYEYVNRAFIKYPAQAKEDLWWGGYNDFDLSDPYCPDNRTPSDAKIPVGLVCRILPNYNMKTLTCEALCNTTEEELKDITDNEPQNVDCADATGAPLQWDLDAFHPGGQYLDHLSTKRTKCCGALTGHNISLYLKCRGEVGDSSQQHETPTPCEDWNPNYKGVGGLSNMSLAYPNRSFSEEILKPDAYTSEAYLVSMKDPYRGATLYISEPYCDAKRTYADGSVSEFDINGDGKFSDEFVDDPRFEGHFLGYCRNKTTGNYKNPTDIICKIDLSEYSSAEEASKACPELGNYSGGLWGTIRYPKGGVAICVPK
ncbi:MAG: hypothetical protein GF387_02825 [Candidatus Portnoybacteria bacterium]|nr:hypothetical protein [Candidatus Portnoybacteria bacterium]